MITAGEVTIIYEVIVAMRVGRVGVRYHHIVNRVIGDHGL